MNETNADREIGRAMRALAPDTRWSDDLVLDGQGKFAA